jgi:hypothetical protein
MLVSLLSRAAFYVLDFPAQRPTQSFKEPYTATVEALPLLAVDAVSYCPGV